MSNYNNNLPSIIYTQKKKYNNPLISKGERHTNFEVDINPKLDSEEIYKKNQELKEIIKELNKKIDFYKTNNQKLSQSITKKNKEINELTNQLILKNNELMKKEIKQKNVKEKKIKEENQGLGMKNENVLEDKLIIKKLKNEVNEVKEEMHRLQLSLLQKEDELFEIKKNKKFTDYQELKIKYETVLNEFNKLRNAKLINSDKNYFLCLESDKMLRCEIKNLQGIIELLNQEKDNYLLEKKKMMDEIDELKSKLELSNNNNKLIKNKKKLFEQKYKKNIKDQVILKEYEEEKKEMIDKINKLQKKLDYYMLNAVKNKEYVINKTNSKIKNEENKNNFASNEIRKNIISVKNVTNPEENYDNKILLMQSLITELTNENKELLEKTKNYEIKINSLLQTNKEILNSNMGLDNIFVSNSAMNNENQQKNENDKKEEKNKDETESISKDDEDQ
jgi:hypothetical protein